MHAKLLTILSLSVLSLVEGQMRCDGGQKCGADAPCCSQYGYCGTSSEHCSAGCNPNLSFRPQSCTNFQGINYPGSNDNSFTFVCNANVRCPSHQPCCSRFGYCGTSSEHCSAGCNTGASFSPWSCSNHGDNNPSAQCSANRRCPDYAPCCSRFGYCGTSQEHCSNGCNILGSWNPSACQDFRPVPIYPQPVYPPIHIPINFPINRPRPHNHHHRPPIYPDFIPARPNPNIRPPFHEPEVQVSLASSNGNAIGDGSNTAMNQQINISPPFISGEGGVNNSPPLDNGPEPDSNQLVLANQKPKTSDQPPFVNVNGGSGSTNNPSSGSGSNTEIQGASDSSTGSSQPPFVESNNKSGPDDSNLNNEVVGLDKSSLPLVDSEKRTGTEAPMASPFPNLSDKPLDNINQQQDFNNNQAPLIEVPKTPIFDTNVVTTNDKPQSSSPEKEPETEIVSREVCQPYQVDFSTVASTNDLPFTTDTPVTQGTGLKFMPNTNLKAKTSYHLGTFTYDLNLINDNGVQIEFLPNDDRLQQKFAITLSKSKLQVLLDNQDKVVDLDGNDTNKKLKIEWTDASINILVNESSLAKFDKLSSSNFPSSVVKFSIQPATTTVDSSTTGTTNDSESFYLKSFDYKC